MPRDQVRDQQSRGYTPSRHAAQAHRALAATQGGDFDGETVLSADPKRAMQDMMQTIDDLRSVYIEETDALENIDTPRFLGLQDKKLATAKKYQKGVEEILTRKDEMRRIDPSLKMKLETMQADFAILATENMDALKRMQRTMERLGNTVRDAARDAVNKQRSYSYSESGNLNSNDKKVVSAGIIETA